MKICRLVSVLIVVVIGAALPLPTALAVTTRNDAIGKFEYTVRQLTNADIEDVEHIATKMFKEERRRGENAVIDYPRRVRFCCAGQNAQEPKFMEASRWKAFDGFGFGVVVDGELVGHITAGFISAEYLRSHALDNLLLPGSYINEIAVLPRYQKAGLAKALIQAVSQYSGERTLSVHVADTDEITLGLFAKLGYQIDPERTQPNVQYLVRREQSKVAPT